MATANLNNEQAMIDASHDSITIVEYIEGVPGGATLDVAGFEAPVVVAGHIIVRNSTTGERKPLPVKDGAYDTIPSGYTCEGVLQHSVLTSQPMAAIMVRGSVNEVASPYPVTAALKTALPHIRFTQD